MRSAVVDLGSNSVRLVVFEGRTRVPVPIFNEKAVLRLGRGLTATGRLNEEAVGQALQVAARYGAVARAMGAEPFEVLATAAVRDAENGPEFVARVQARLPGVRVRVLSGEEEAQFSASGLLCGIPGADGVLADIGGGSLELVRLKAGVSSRARTLRLGVIRLADRSKGDLTRAREIAEADLAGVTWLPEMAGRDLYLVGGAWRALARVHIAQSGYPLNIVHHYAVAAEAAREFAGAMAGAPRRVLERLPGVPRRRIDDLPYAALVLRRLLRVTGAARVVFSANGLREGWYLAQMPGPIRAQEPVLAVCEDYAQRLARDPGLPPALIAWTAALFPGEDPASRRRREAACWVSDIGSRDHPEYRAEQSFLRMLRQPGVAADHPLRAFLAQVLAERYEAPADAPYLAPARALLGEAERRQAEILGAALRLAYTLSAGTRALLAMAELRIEGGRVVLSLGSGDGVFSGETLDRRMERLAQTMGLPAGLETRFAAV